MPCSKRKRGYKKTLINKKSKKVSVNEFKSGMLSGKFNTPKKSKISLKSNKLNSPSVTSQTRKILCDSIETCNVIKKEISINKAFCTENNVRYISEVIAQIISAKEIKELFKIFTPFGDCNLRFMSNNNYRAVVNGVSAQAGTYDFLLSAINNFKNKNKLIEEISNFLSCEIKEDFTFNLEGDICKNIYDVMRDHMDNTAINNIDTQVEYCKGYRGKAFKITYKDVAALMCGVFISEMIRSAGKLVRSAFLNDEWPEDAEKLRKKFLQSNKRGNEKFRNALMHKSSECVDILKRALATVSPLKKKIKK